jgi:hypothetical protein
MTIHQEQGPADNCVIDGKNLGWLSCTAYAAAMGIDWASGGEFTPSGCTVRRRTEDTIGGLTLAQVEPVIEEYGITTDRRTSWRAASPSLLANRLADEQGFVAQGNTGVLIGTAFQSTAGWVNHAVWVQGPGYGWRWVNGLYRPDTVDVFDPAADGRRSYIAQGPDRWPWNTLLRFCAALRPNGDSDPDTIGPGKAWVMFLERLATGWRAHVGPGRFWAYTLSGRYIVSRERVATANGFSAMSTPPEEYRVHSTAQAQFPDDDYYLTRLLSGSRAGYYIGAQYAREVDA